MIGKSVLSEAFQEAIGDRRLVSAVFTTFEFEPEFFEVEILPLFFDAALCHVPGIRLLQLEKELRDVSEIAVYYDADRLRVGERSASLDVKRIPVRLGHGAFHGKNVFLLLESRDEDGTSSKTLLAASLSANLTRNGWWENVEVGHIEELQERDETRLKLDIKEFLENLLAVVKKDEADEHRAIEDILKFLRRTSQVERRSSDGCLHTHFYSGKSSFLDFLSYASGDRLKNLYLEIISPYFDKADSSNPLEELIRWARPEEVRVYLPRGQDGEALCEKSLYESFSDYDGLYWGRLRKDVVNLRLNDAENARQRFVHAKIYRFFDPKGRTEYLFIGSVNLTRAAHQRGGNLESGFLVETSTRSRERPVFWLEREVKPPSVFIAKDEGDESERPGSSPLNLIFNWATVECRAYWDSPRDSPRLRVEGHRRGVVIGEIETLPPQIQVKLPAEFAQNLRSVLTETSFALVKEQSGAEAILLVQEEGMAQKPSILTKLTWQDILKSWSLLTRDQQAAFLYQMALRHGLDETEPPEYVEKFLKGDANTLFDRFAGIFHAFASLERAVLSALGQGSDGRANEKQARHLLFGKKYDSLGEVIERVKSMEGNGSGEAVDRYLIVLCATQLLEKVRESVPDFWVRSQDEAKAIMHEVRELGRSEARQKLLLDSSTIDERFLDWFERWFMKRATPIGELA